MTFNPKEHITKIKGKDYLEVKWRVAWLRDENPLWAINTDVFEIGGAIVCKASIADENGNLIASGMATVREASKSEFTWSGREFEKAETAAIGRALAHAGYGTQFCGDEMDESGYLADSPVKNQPPVSNSKSSEYQNQKPKQKQVLLQDVRRKESKDGKKKWLSFTTAGGIECSAWARTPFIEAGYVTDTDWPKDKIDVVWEVDPQIPCFVNLNDKGYYIIDVDSIPPFNPDWEALHAGTPATDKEFGDVPL